MITKITWFKFQNQIKGLFPTLVISLIITLCCLVLQKINTPWALLLSSFFTVIAVIAGVVPTLACILLGWSDFYHSFYGNRAYLIRTLSLSRREIFTSYLLNIGISLGISITWTLSTLLICYPVIPFSKEIIFFGLTIFLQALFIELCGVGGTILGYRKLSFKLDWSIGFGFLIYFIGNLSISIPGIQLLSSYGGSTPSVSLSIDLIKNFILLAIALYLLLISILLIGEYTLLNKKADVE